MKYKREKNQKSPFWARFVTMILFMSFLCHLGYTQEVSGEIKNHFYEIPDLKKGRPYTLQWTSDQPGDSIHLWLYRKDKMIYEIGKSDGISNSKKWKVPKSVESTRGYYIRGLINGQIIESNLFRIEDAVIDEVTYIRQKFIENESNLMRFSEAAENDSLAKFRFAHIRILTRGITNKIHWESAVPPESIKFWLYQQDVNIGYLGETKENGGSSQIMIPSTLRPGNNYSLRAYPYEFNEAYESNPFEIKGNYGENKAGIVVIATAVGIPVTLVVIQATLCAILGGNIFSGDCGSGLIVIL